ncbi:MAG: hypothetical protein H7X95_09180 [Deltaproteobacteria bacterium]|nr:hypothetical protein [Deltaproteobacteria bacterium]
MSRSFVTLPAWFSAQKAASVLKSLKRNYVLVADPRAASSLRVASLGDLLGAPIDKTVEWCAPPAAAFLGPLQSADEAWQVMLNANAEYLPVKVGGLVEGSTGGFVGGSVAGLILGVVTRSSLKAVVFSQADTNSQEAGQTSFAANLAA